jgi:hypothetical protein
MFVPNFFSHGVTRMNQTLLFPDVLSDRLAAIEADVDSAGGKQIVGHKLGLHDDPVEAGKLLSNKIRKNGRHRLTDEDTWQIRQLARESSAGRSRLSDLESAALNFEGRWLTSDDIKARRKKRKAVLLRELIELEQEEE